MRNKEDIELKHDILFASNDRSLIEALDSEMRAQFNFHFIESTQELLKFAKNHRFHLLVIDIDLSDSAPLTLYQQLLDTTEAHQFQSIVLSNLCNVDTVLDAYELGASDYICKPVNPLLFKQRIKNLSQLHNRIIELEQRDKETQSVTKSVMQQSAAYGNGLDLITKLHQCHTPNFLADAILNHLFSQGFHAAIQLRSNKGIFSFDVDFGQCTDIELEIFDLIKNRGRITHFGKRTIFNDEHVSIFIKNMPAQSSRTYDVILDMLAKITPAIDARFIAICEHQALVKAKNILSNAMMSISQNVSKMESDNRKLIESIESKVAMSFHKLEFDEEQESYFVNLIENEISQKASPGYLDLIQESIAECVESLKIVENTEVNTPEVKNDVTDVELF